MNLSKQLTISHHTYLTIEDVWYAANRYTKIKLSTSSDFTNLIKAGSDFLDDCSRSGDEIYGVNTGYGDSCNRKIDNEKLDELPINLYRFLGCGSGDAFTVRVGRAILLARLRSLVNGVSGVRLSLLQSIEKFINQDIIPVIPSQGSLGASGDLIPLSYLSAVLAGERNVFYNNEVLPAKMVLKKHDISPFIFKPKETLAIVNGTAVMTAIASLVHYSARRISFFADIVTCFSALALKSSHEHFDDNYFKHKPHPGQNLSAKFISLLLKESQQECDPSRLQERYSIRCAPHVIGVLNDALTWYRSAIEIELNSANDNPLIDGYSKKVMHGGHFYGGHIAFCMDSLKIAIANISDLVDRQIALLVDEKFNNGLSSNLTGHANGINHGLKGVQILASALTSEVMKNSTPASIFSRSTECHNQDKVSLGTIAARDCLNMIDDVEKVIACGLLTSIQALELRMTLENKSVYDIKGLPLEILTFVRNKCSFVLNDKELEQELMAVTKIIQNYDLK